MTDVRPDVLEFLAGALLPRRWVFAKTMANHPHWYTLRREWADDQLFDEVIQTIRDHGYTEYFYRKPYTMLNLNGMKYWTVGQEAPVEPLINRTHIMSPADYDQIAGQYDHLHIAPECLTENKEVIKRLSYQGGSVLDIGCGTGLLLDYLAPDEYTGIDPSAGMLRILSQKHPEARVIKTRFEEYVGRADLVVSLFGAANYITPQAISNLPRVVAPGGRWFIMFYKDEYHPVTYERAGVEVKHYKGTYTLLPGDLSELGNFWIVEGRRS